MKKLSFVLALILACGVLASCGEDTETTTAAPGNSNVNTTEKPSSADTVTTKAPDESKPAETSTGDSSAAPSTPASGEEEEKPKDELIDGSKFTVDGDLAEWEGLHTMVLEGEASTVGKKATFYGAMTTTGLYLACDAYHDVYKSGDGTWWANSNFEIFIESNSEQLFAYADGIGADCLTGVGGSATGKITSAVMKTTELSDDATKYHTVTEVFISNEDLPEDCVWLNTVSVGVAWKTVSDLIIGGQYHFNADGSDEYWAVRGEDADGAYNVPNCAMVATPKGLYWFEDYMD